MIATLTGLTAPIAFAFSYRVLSISSVRTRAPLAPNPARGLG